MKLRIVLTGAPCSGKTTTLNALKEKLKNDKSFRFIDEVATKYIHSQRDAGIDPFANLIKFEQTMMNQQAEEEDAIREEGTCTILDRSMIDNLAITEMLEVGKKENIDVVGPMENAVRSRSYDLVFILDRLPFQKTADRRENDDREAIKQDEFIRRTYNRFSQECGYSIVSVPVASIDDRVNMIIDKIRQLQLHQLAATPAALTAKLGLFGESLAKLKASTSYKNDAAAIRMERC